jgi:hypothetical protein
LLQFSPGSELPAHPIKQPNQVNNNNSAGWSTQLPSNRLAGDNAGPIKNPDGLTKSDGNWTLDTNGDVIQMCIFKIQYRLGI